MATQQTSKAASVQDDSRFVKNFAIGAGIATTVIIAVLLVPELRRDKWEVNEGSFIQDRLREADQLRSCDVIRANDIYEQVLAEAGQHAITNESLRQVLLDAEQKKNALKALVQKELARRAAVQQRLDRQRQLDDQRQRQFVEQQNFNSGVSTPYTRSLDSADATTRNATLADQFGRSEAWVKEHTSPSDSSSDAIIKLTKERLRESW